MRIEGFFKGPVPFPNVHVLPASAGIDESIAFLVDTGASRSAVLDGDALRLRMRTVPLPKASQPLTGIGGSVEALQIPDAELVLRAEPLEFSMAMPLLVVRHRLDRLSETERKRVLRLPSILGRDFLQHFDLRLSIRRGSLHLDTYSLGEEKPEDVPTWLLPPKR